MNNNKYAFTKYKKIRTLSYNNEKKVLKTYDIDINDWWSKPYTCFKIRFYIELSSLFVYFLQFTKIKPNQISYVYAGSSIFGALCLSLENYYFILLGIFLFFFKIVIDGTDGLLARVKYKPTNLGEIIDTWGGFVAEISFMIGLGFYIFNITSDQLYLYLLTITISIKAIDLKKYVFLHIGASKYNESYLLKEKSINKIKLKKSKNKFLNFSKKLILDGFNYNAKSMDLVLFGILIELIYKKLIFTHYFFYLYIIRGVIIFFANFYLVNRDNSFILLALKNNIKFKNK